MTIQITGHSDDVIHIDGDINEEVSEFGVWRFIHFNDGTVIQAGHDMEDGKGWTIRPVYTGKSATVVTHEPLLEGNGAHRSDVVEVDSPAITRFDAWAHEDGPSHEELCKWFGDLDERDFHEYDFDRLREAYSKLHD